MYPREFLSMFEPVTVDSVNFSAIQSVLVMGRQYQFDDGEPGGIVILDPSFPTEVPVIERIRDIIADWDRVEGDGGTLYKRPSDH